MARARWDRYEEKLREQMPERERQLEEERICNEHSRREGDYVGTLEWRDRSGKVRKWVIRRGPRFNQLFIDGASTPKTVTKLMEHLRRSLASYFRASY